MTPDEQGIGQEIDDLSRAAETLIAGPPEFLRAFTGDDAGARRQRRAIVIASLREQEAQGRVGVSVDELAADLEAVLRRRGVAAPERALDLRAEVVEILRQLEGWNAVDGGLAPERAERDGLRRRVERDYALARSLRVFLPRWDEVQRLLRRRYISLSANYFAQAIAALDTLLEELHYEDTDPLRCHTAWQSLHQALHGINTETRDFARELRSLRVDGNHPEVLADIADRLGILHEKFFRVAAEGAAKVRDRLELLRDERHDGENVRRLQDALRAREEEWSVGIGETEADRLERLDEVARDVIKELNLFDRFMADSGPGSWREGAKIISLALVDLTERIHAAISLRLQQTQAIAALHRRARDLAEGIGPGAEGVPRGAGRSQNAPTATTERLSSGPSRDANERLQRARQYLWNASGSVHAAVWVHPVPASDDQVRLERWLLAKGGSPLPLVEDEIWQRSIRPRMRPAPPPPPPPLELADDWDPGSDPRIRELEEARARLVERLIAAGSAAGLEYLHTFEELRLLASFLWLPRNSAPLRRLGLRIQPPGAGMAARAMLRGPGFEVELDNYRFTSTTDTARPAARKSESARDAVGARLGTPVAIDPITREIPVPPPAAPTTPRRPNPLSPFPRKEGARQMPPIAARASASQPSSRASTPLSQPRTRPQPADAYEELGDPDANPLTTRPMPAVHVDSQPLGPRPTVPVPAISLPLADPAQPAATNGEQHRTSGMASAWAEPQPRETERSPSTSGRRFWPFGRKGNQAEAGRRDGG
ncbi:MAG TPA: hypothetical protein VF116_21900 [Ktedonobacterales bacterium]